VRLFGSDGFGLRCGANIEIVSIDQVLPMAEVVEAHHLSESGRVRGKIVLAAWNSTV